MMLRILSTSIRQKVGNKMAEYHIGCGAFGIYAGILNKNKNMWVSKSEVTDEVLSSAFDYLYGNKKEFIAKVDGKEYVMRIVPYKLESEVKE